jgi:hypothetical protein
MMTTAILKETFPIFPVAMRSVIPILLLLPVLVGNPTVAAQSRIPFNGRQLFLSGSNVAWVNFAADIGPGPTDTGTFRDMFDSLRAGGGNAMRFWLHTNGAATPEFDSAGLVTGPGVGAIADLKSILDAAYDRKVGLILCLWSFDMLRISYGSGITGRAAVLLTDTVATKAYIDHALVPMINALKGHPGIIAWEVCNEPEGMSSEFGWSFTHHVPMNTIQRFVNRIAGAIHRTDPGARVTTGAWSLLSLTDALDVAKPPDPATLLQTLTREERIHIETRFAGRYGTMLPVEDILRQYDGLHRGNYYLDDRLIAAGGDSLGVLDFYTVHYYDWAGTALSPFFHPFGHWALTKPLVVAEFFLDDSFGLRYNALYQALYALGYAGALSWQWHQNPVQQDRTKEVMRGLYARYARDIDPDSLQGGTGISPPTFVSLESFPNPCNGFTTVEFVIPQQSNVQIAVYDVQGRRVQELVNGTRQAGYHVTGWTPAVASGVYLCRMVAEGLAPGGGYSAATRKILVVR